eukprot:421096-Hanusia_phi.AAC.3
MVQVSTRCSVDRIWIKTSSSRTTGTWADGSSTRETRKLARVDKGGENVDGCVFGMNNESCKPPEDKDTRPEENE